MIKAESDNEAYVPSLRKLSMAVNNFIQRYRTTCLTDVGTVVTVRGLLRLAER